MDNDKTIPTNSKVKPSMLSESSKDKPLEMPAASFGPREFCGIVGAMSVIGPSILAHQPMNSPMMKSYLLARTHLVWYAVLTTGMSIYRMRKYNSEE